jgi:hypothetical protein
MSNTDVEMSNTDVEMSENTNSKDYEGYNFIDTQTKSNPNFMQHLANLAASDSKHDFGQEYVKSDNVIITIYNTGIPKSFDKVYDESGSVKSVLQNGQTLQAMFPGDTKTADFDIKHLEQETGKVLHRYTGIKEYIKKDGVYNEGGQFVEKCQLLDSILVIDFNQNGFLSMLKNGKSDLEKKMYYVMIPELENDPAGKTPVDDKLFKRESGVDLRAMLDMTDKTIVYNEYDMNSEVFSNNFFSNYNFQLSPITSTKGISGKVTSKSVSLNIFKKNTIGGNILNQAEIKNCKKENSIDSLLKFLKNFFKLISGSNKSDPTSDFNYNVKLQQKRSGDWFQVLACLDIYNRKFKDYNDPNKDVNFTKQNNNVYFVTHDQIACSYALIMGVNVIFINEKNAYVLTNVETVANDVSPLERLFNNYQPNIWTLEEKNVEFTKMRKFLDEYRLLRDEYLKNYENAINQDVKELYNKIVPPPPASPSLTCNNEKEADSYMEIIKKLFHNCVLYSNIKTSLPDPTDIISDLNNDEYLNAFKEYNVSNNDKINIVVNSYNKAISIKNQHGQGKESIVWQSSRWENLLKKSDAYTSVSDWVWKKKISSRIKSFFTSGTSSRKNDIYLFLSFIDTIDDSIAKQVTEVFDKYRQIVDNTRTGQNAWSNKNDKEDYIKNNSELIAQINVFLRRESRQELFDEDKKAFIEQQTNSYSQENTNINILSDSVLVEENTTSLINNNNKDFIEASSEIKEDDYDLMNDISIQETTNPLLTACLVYNWSTNKSESMVDEIINNEIMDSGNENYSNKLRRIGGGAAIDLNSIKINDSTIAYHPLLPIYMIACSYNCNINSDLEGSIDYDEYLKYYNFLEKMTHVLFSNYLGNKNNIAKAYLIGLALRELLFTLNRDEDGINAICNNGDKSLLSNINIDEYQSFSLMNSMLSDYISGKIEETELEKGFGLKLLLSSVFKKFINEDINIKEILTKPPTSKSINTLKNDSLKLIILIKNKIIADRKSTTSISTSTNVSSSLTSTISQNSIPTPTTFSSGRSTEERENLSQTNSNSRKRSRDEITTRGGVKTKKRKYKRILKTKQRNSKKNGKKGKKTIKKRKGKGNKKTRKH